MPLFLGEAYGVLQGTLECLGVENVDDLQELEPKNVEELASMLKPVQGRKFRKALASLC